MSSGSTPLPPDSASPPSPGRPPAGAMQPADGASAASSAATALLQQQAMATPFDAGPASPGGDSDALMSQPRRQTSTVTSRAASPSSGRQAKISRGAAQMEVGAAVPSERFDIGIPADHWDGLLNKAKMDHFCHALNLKLADRFEEVEGWPSHREPVGRV